MKNETIIKLNKVFKERCSTKTLHILNGMVMANYFQENNLKEDENIYIPFNEAICWGEVDVDIFSDNFIEKRAKSLHSSVDMYKEIVIDNLKELFEGNFQSIVLWFGDDMFCQMNFITILAFLDQIDYKGDIFLSMVQEQKDELLEEAIEINCEGYKEIFKTILINKEKYKGKLLPVTYEGMNLYLNYRSEDGDIMKYIKNNLQDKDLVSKLLKLFPQYGLGDMQYKWMVEELVNLE